MTNSQRKNSTMAYTYTTLDPTAASWLSTTFQTPQATPVPQQNMMAPEVDSDAASSSSSPRHFTNMDEERRIPISVTEMGEDQQVPNGGVGSFEMLEETFPVKMEVKDPDRDFLQLYSYASDNSYNGPPPQAVGPLLSDTSSTNTGLNMELGNMGNALHELGPDSQEYQHVNQFFPTSAASRISTITPPTSSATLGDITPSYNAYRQSPSPVPRRAISHEVPRPQAHRPRFTSVPETRTANPSEIVRFERYVVPSPPTSPSPVFSQESDADIEEFRRRMNKKDLKGGRWTCMFFWALLNNDRTSGCLIKWIDESKLAFQVVENSTKRVTELWGNKEKGLKCTPYKESWDNLTGRVRYSLKKKDEHFFIDYYKSEDCKDLPRKRCFRFKKSLEEMFQGEDLHRSEFAVVDADLKAAINAGGLEV